MGTHISRVKSVDLDAWTDEQLQSVLRWGNSRANKYAAMLKRSVRYAEDPQVLGIKTGPRTCSVRRVCQHDAKSGMSMLIGS